MTPVVNSPESPRRFRDLFSARAAQYAAHRPSYPTALVDYLASLAPKTTCAWDCGCGSGQLAVLLASRFEHVLATDASAEQIAHAVAQPRVAYRVAAAEESGLNNASVDLIAAAQAAHWFDLPAFYAEVRRTARPGAVLALFCYELMHVDAGVDAVVRRFYIDVLEPYWPPERRYIQAGYRTLPFPFAEVEAPHFEMRAEWSRQALAGYVETWSAVSALAAAEGDARVRAFHDELATAWPQSEPRTVRWPLALRVGYV